jgi:hypothetical protein
MVAASAPHCLRYPEGTHVEVASLPMLKTIIITLQGVSALYVLIGAMSGAELPGDAIGFGIDTLFFPLAILGLLRLCAATWLTEDFVYQRDGLRNVTPIETATQVHQRITSKDNDIELDDHSRALDPLMSSPFTSRGFKSPTNSWSSRFFRIFFLLLLGGVWTIALLIAVPVFGDLWFTTTTFLLGLFYFMFITVSLVLYTFYFLRGQTTTTILPCISSTWYKLYTMLLMGLMMALIVVASIETNKSPTGMYTSVELPTKMACADLNDWWTLSSGSPWIGFAADRKLHAWLTRNQTSLQVMGEEDSGFSTFWLYNFTGYCRGHFNDM